MTIRDKKDLSRMSRTRYEEETPARRKGFIQIDVPGTGLPDPPASTKSFAIPGPRSSTDRTAVS